MEYYREVYKDSPKWDGSPNKRLIIYSEQGQGDQIQMARYISRLNCHTIVHCPKSLHRLMLSIKGVNEVIDKNEYVLPPHDCHALSLSLPFILNSIEAEVPYIKAEKADIPHYEELKIGIAWEGSPANPQNKQRCCHLKHFRNLPGKLFMLADAINDMSLVEGCEDMELLGVEKTDFKDTAELIEAMDVIATVDTAVLHLAGAMGKPCYALLCHEHDARWKITNWYPSVKFIRQPKPDEWEPVFSTLRFALATQYKTGSAQSNGDGQKQPAVIKENAN
jgi:hypothetical protein